MWVGYTSPPWRSLSEPELRAFLLERAADGFTFPLNPVWPIRDKGWYAVLEALKKTPDGPTNLAAWYPPESGVLQRIDELHAAHPDGFAIERAAPQPDPADKPPMNKLHVMKSARSVLNALADLSAMEMADFSIEVEVKREVRARWARVRASVCVEALHRRQAMKLHARAQASTRGPKLEPIPTSPKKSPR